KGEWDANLAELNQVNADLQRLNADQDRIRKNLRETPKEAEVYQTYLRKLSDQEKEIDGLTARQKKLMDGEFAARKKYEDFLANPSAGPDDCRPVAASDADPEPPGSLPRTKPPPPRPRPPPTGQIPHSHGLSLFCTFRNSMYCERPPMVFSA